MISKPELEKPPKNLNTNTAWHKQTWKVENYKPNIKMFAFCLLNKDI